MRWAIIGAKGSDTLEFHLQNSLLHSGHEVKIFDLSFVMDRGMTIHYWLRRISEKYDETSAKKLAHQILAYDPDVVLGTYRIIHPHTIEIIKKARPSIITIHMNPDHLANLEQQQIIASSYDHLFTKDPYVHRFLREKAKLNAHYLPEAFNPRFHKSEVLDKKKAEQEDDTDILIFGNLYPYRVRFIEQIVEAGFKVRLFGVEGPYFPDKLRRYFNDHLILGEDKAKKIMSAKIVLNNFHYAEIEGVNCKYFEINGMGGFQICDFKNILEEYSPVHPFRYSFNSTDQAIELLHHYLNQPQERHEIAELNRNHFLANHTYENRIKSIIDIIKT